MEENIKNETPYRKAIRERNKEMAAYAASMKEQGFRGSVIISTLMRRYKIYSTQGVYAALKKGRMDNE